AEGVKEIISNNYVLNKVIFHGFSGLGFILGIALLFFSPLENGLPIRARYPFNTTIPPWQQIAFGVETCTVLGGLLSIVAMDSLTTLKCSLITTLFNVLNANFENCTSRNENTDKFCEGYERKLNNKFHRRYKTCIQFHQRLVSMTNDYNRIYSSSMFVQMLSSTSMICLTGFQAVVVGGQSSDIFKFGVYLSAAVSQLFYACWIGNELSYASTVVDRSLWLSDWHYENLQSILQTFTLSMTFSRQPLVLKAGVFYVLSLQTFIVIIKRSYSAFTLLNNMDV
ncbi:putative odorant receptor 85d, partial [Ceratina calcarata]|uniref:Odorant receptor 85d n=1 Tax=Ceratina calcarata TaxID=156304 RepID=A0AAJ7JER0_9HYME